MKKINLDNLKPREIISGYNVKFVHSENMTFAYWDIKANAILPEHSHPNEQVSNIIKGEFELIIDNKPQILKANSIIIIPKNTKHSGRAITDCKIIDVFYPIREDYLQKN